MPQIIDFVKQEDVDILMFQEVSGGSLSFDNLDCFQILQEKLDYNGDIAVAWRLASDPLSYFGNATFYKKRFSVVGKDVLWLKKYAEIENLQTYPIEEQPRSALSLLFDFSGKRVWTVNVHLAWGPTGEDQPHKVTQGKIFVDFMKTFREPFIISGDFNVDHSSQIVSWLSDFSRNLIVEHGITNTLNPRVHPAKHLFPKGLGVDFMFVEKTIVVKEFKALEDKNLSDHIGLSLTFEL